MKSVLGFVASCLFGVAAGVANKDSSVGFLVATGALATFETLFQLFKK